MLLLVHRSSHEIQAKTCSSVNYKTTSKSPDGMCGRRGPGPIASTRLYVVSIFFEYIHEVGEKIRIKK